NRQRIIESASVDAHARAAGEWTLGRARSGDLHLRRVAETAAEAHLCSGADVPDSDADRTSDRARTVGRGVARAWAHHNDLIEIHTDDLRFGGAEEYLERSLERIADDGDARSAADRAGRRLKCANDRRERRRGEREAA